MAFLGGLFRKKPGGSFFGNLIRGGLNTVSGGLLGTGKNVIPATGTQPPGVYTPALPYPGYTAPPDPLQAIISTLLNKAQPGADQLAEGSFKAVIKKYWWVGLLLGVTIGMGIWIMTRNKKRR